MDGGARVRMPAGTFDDDPTGWLGWAGRYDGYRMLGDSPSTLGQVIEPGRTAYAETGQVPAWAGEHLLRGWLFYLYRADHHYGGTGLQPGGSIRAEWDAVVDALRAFEPPP